MLKDVDLQSLHAWVDEAVDYVAYRLRKDPAHPLQAAVEMVSPSMETVHGASDRHDVSTWFEAVHPDDLPRILEAHLRADQTDEVFDERYRVQIDGKVRWVHTTSRPAFDAEGVVTHYNGLIVDITRQVEAEEAVREAQEALARTQRAAAAGWLAMGVVHDLNNVLQVVQMACIIARDEGDDTVRELMDEVLGAVGRGAAVGERLAGHFRAPSRPETFDLAAAVRQTCRLFGLSRPQVRVTYAGPETCNLQTVAVTVENALLNLLANAADAAGKDGSIEVHLSQDDDVSIRVSDDGPGIPTDQIEEVFQARFSTKGSTGLGLASSREGLQSIGGSLELVPTERGACFEVRLPERVPASDGAEEAAAPETGPMRVFVAESEHGDLLRRMVALLGHVVVPEQEAEVHLVDDRPHQAPSFPAVLLDGRAGASHHHGGFVGRLRKPFRIDELERALQAARKEGRSARSTNHQAG